MEASESVYDGTRGEGLTLFFNLEVIRIPAPAGHFASARHFRLTFAFLEIINPNIYTCGPQAA